MSPTEQRNGRTPIQGDGPGQTPVPAGPPEGPRRGLLAEHLGLFLTGGAATLAAFRLMAAANLDPVTAMAILQNIGVANAVVGTFVVLLPGLMTIALMGVVSARIGQPANSQVKGLLDTAIIMLAATCFFMTPWPYLVGVVGVASGRYLKIRFRRSGRAAVDDRSRARRRASRLLDQLTVGYGIVLLVLIVLGTQPWFAPELIQAGNETTLGYVLRAENDELVVLRQNDRAVLYIHGRADRSICSSPISPFEGRSFFQVLFPSREPYKPCPSDQ